MRYTLFLITLFILNPSIFAYESRPIDFTMTLGLPIKINMVLAGNFCEMRPNHFHTGIDIKTNNTEGYRLYAIEDGIISRIRNSPWGYGKAIYVEHTNGLTSVFAHCSEFPTMIDSLVFAIQASQESAIIDQDVSAYKIPVKKGDVIAFSGNSGSSSAPHLHFEIRETKTELAINPLLFKCYRKLIKDSKSPEMRGVKLYALTKQGFLIPGKSLYFPIKKVNGKWVINDNKPLNIDKILVKNSQLGIGLYSIDKLDEAYNNCGVYETKLSHDNKIIQHQKMDYMNFDFNRFLNSHQDYFAYKNEKKHIHKQFSTTINPLPIYPINNGRIAWRNCEGAYALDIKDIHGNQSHLNFTIQKTSTTYLSNILESKRYHYPDSVNTISMDGMEAVIEKSTFYEPIQHYIKTTNFNANRPYLSGIYQLFEYQIPVQAKYDIRIKVPEFAESLPQHKIGIALIDPRNRINYQGGKIEDGWVTTQVRNFGKFALVIDTISPVISPLDFKNNQNISKYSTLEMKISDNLSGLLYYKAYLNNNWVLLEYYRRKGKYIIFLNGRTKQFLNSGNNTIKIIAVDKKKNKSIIEHNLIYKPKA